MNATKRRKEDPQIRVAAEYHAAAKRYAEQVRPKSTLQYVVEAAIEEYLKENDPEYAANKKKRDNATT